ncbi:MAG: hypothetical protein WD768_08070 [Phycisphaeraceae bacterium]
MPVSCFQTCTFAQAPGAQMKSFQPCYFTPSPGEQLASMMGVILVVTAAAAVFILLIVLWDRRGRRNARWRRRRQGRCVKCNYYIAPSLRDGSTCCPECGEPALHVQVGRTPFPMDAG